MIIQQQQKKKIRIEEETNLKKMHSCNKLISLNINENISIDRTPCVCTLN